MKQILLFFALLLPFCAFSQINESFSGIEITPDSPWEGDIDMFSVNESDQLQFISPQAEAGEASLFLPLPYNEDMSWELGVGLDFKSTNANNLHISVYEDNGILYYIQAGNNKGQVSLYAKEGTKSPKLCIKGREGIASDSFVSLRLTLENGKQWTLYTRTAVETAYHKEGSYAMKYTVVEPDTYIRLTCRYIKSRISYFLLDNIRVDRQTKETFEENEETETPEEPTEQDVQPGEIIFNELLPNPFTGGSEYIELFNKSKRSLSLKGLAVAIRKADGTLQKQYPLSDISSSIKAGGYALLTKEIETVSGFYFIASPNVLFEVKLPVLANTSSTLVLLRMSDGISIDEVTYSAKWHDSSVKETKGVALERINPDRPSQEASNWTSATAMAGYGTPGYQNAQHTEQEGVITHIEPPVPVSDGTYQITYQLTNPGYHCRAYVYNLNGYRIAEIANHELLSTTGRLIWDGKSSNGVHLSPGLYIIHMELYTNKGDKITYKKPFLIR